MMTTDTYKYGRTYHLDFSPGLQNDDKRIDSLANLVGKEIVVTEKMDGENTTLTPLRFHARSLDSPYNFTRSYIKQLHNVIRHEIPDSWRFCGENPSYYHSIFYDSLRSPFYLFSVWNEDNWSLHWDETLEWADMINSLPPIFGGMDNMAVPRTFYRGVFDLDVLKELGERITEFNAVGGPQIEGFVARTVEGFPYADFSTHLTKWVRPGHVQTPDKHWLEQTYPNKYGTHEDGFTFDVAPKFRR